MLALRLRWMLLTADDRTLAGLVACLWLLLAVGPLTQTSFTYLLGPPFA
jgi:hypothetical protein